MMRKTVLLIATFDTKEAEALFLKGRIEAQGCHVLTMDTGILAPPQGPVDVPQGEVARRGGASLADLIAGGNKGDCIQNMMRGAEIIARELYEAGRIDGVIGIGGAQGTDMATAAMRSLPVGIPKLMVSTVASGRATFGPYVGTKDIALMHSVADLQGLNFLTKRILNNAAGAMVGMLKEGAFLVQKEGIPVALSMLGTTTPGALRAKASLERHGFEVVTFHQNGTGGIAMEDMIREGAFRAVLDLNLHEVADRLLGGLHGAIRADRLEAAGEKGLPQVVVPGSVNYMVKGPLDTLTFELRKRRLIVHNPNLTLVGLEREEMAEVGRVIAEKLNRAKGPVHVFIPLKGFCYPDREGYPLWYPEAQEAFIAALRGHLKSSILITDLPAHINDDDFIDAVVDTFLKMVGVEKHV